MRTSTTCTLLAGLALAGLAAAAPRALTSPATAPAPAATYEVDAGHSTVLFKILHVGTSWTYGRFDTLSGSFTIDAEHPEKSQIAMTVDVASVDTNNKKRDDHLRGPDFFDVKQFAQAKFTSTAAKSTGKTTWSVSGDLSLHGVTKPVTLSVDQVGTSDTPMMGKRAGFHGTVAFKRSDFGMKSMLEGIGDEVTLTISLEGAQR